VGTLDSCFVGYHEKLSVFLKDELQILVTKRYHSPVVDYDVRKQCICLFVAGVYRLLVELKLADAKTTEHHERRHDRDNYCQLPTEVKANSAAKNQSKARFNRYPERLGG